MTRPEPLKVEVEVSARIKHPSIEERFPAAATSAPPTDEQRAAVATIQQGVLGLAHLIDAECPDGRDKWHALTLLEDVLMRANRAVFTADQE